MSADGLYIGCAGWKLGREYWPDFEGEGTHLERYASRLTAVEINSSFYRSHRPGTYAKWAASVNPGFRFSVKVPKSITHENRLVDCSALLDTFLAECLALGSKLGCLLVKLPPSLQFDARIAGVDPGRISGDDEPSGWQGIRYWRLHGSPRIYYSCYETEWLERLVQRVEATMADGVPTWCIFDNTARDAALGNARLVQTLLR